MAFGAPLRDGDQLCFPAGALVGAMQAEAVHGDRDSGNGRIRDRLARVERLRHQAGSMEFREFAAVHPFVPL